MSLFGWLKRQPHTEETSTQAPTPPVPTQPVSDWEKVPLYVEVDPKTIATQVAIMTAVLSGESTAKLRIKRIYEKNEEAKLVGLIVAATVSQETTGHLAVRQIERKVMNEHA